MFNRKLKKKWNDRYLAKDTPWDLGIYNLEMQRLFATYVPLGQEVLDIGCGMGTNTRWIAEAGYNVTGIDLAPAAIETAKIEAKRNNLAIKFYEMDFLVEWPQLNTFPVLFDCAVFNTLFKKRKRKQFVRAAAHVCQPGGYWINISTSKDDAKEISLKTNSKLPPVIAMKDIIAVVEPEFEIIEVRRCAFTLSRPNSGQVSFNAWASVFKKRSR